MNETSCDLGKRLLYILHGGLTEIRGLALAAGHERITELADALEILPRFISGQKDDLELLRFVLKNYQDKHHSSFDYPARLDKYETPERY